MSEFRYLARIIGRIHLPCCECHSKAPGTHTSISPLSFRMNALRWPIIIPMPLTQRSTGSPYSLGNLPVLLIHREGTNYPFSTGGSPFSPSGSLPPGRQRRRKRWGRAKWIAMAFYTYLSASIFSPCLSRLFLSSACAPVMPHTVSPIRTGLVFLEKVKGLVHLKMRILLFVSHPHAFQNLYDFLFLTHKKRVIYRIFMLFSILLIANFTCSSYSFI